MTDGKDFKRRVRERMRKTGETYTAARRQVLGQRDGVRRLAGQLLVEGGPLRDGWVALRPWVPLDQLRLDGPIGVGRQGFGWRVPKRSTRADQQGRFVLDAPPGKKVLLAGASGCRSVARELDWTGEQALGPVRLEWLNPAVLPIEVRLQAGGGPLATRTLRVATRQGTDDHVADVELDAAGRGELTLLPGAYELVAASEWTAGAFRIRSERVRVDLVPGPNPELLLEVTTPAERPAIEVRVVDAAGQPVPGALVVCTSGAGSAGSISLDHPDWPGQQVADRDGVARFEGLAFGARTAVARAGFLYGTSPPAPLDRLGQRHVREVVLDRSVASGHVRVRVPDAPAGVSFTFLAVWEEDGRPASRKREAWAPPGGGHALEGRAFTFHDLPPGPVDVSFWAEVPGPTGPVRSWGVSWTGTRVRTGETVEVELRMRPAAPPLRVRFLDPDGAPLAGADVLVQRRPGQSGGTVLSADAAGRLAIHGLSPGEPCALTVVAPGWATQQFDGLLAGGPEQDLRWPSPWAVLRVADAQGRAIPARVETTRADLGEALQTDVDGVLRFAAVGPLTIHSVRAEGWAQAQVRWEPGPDDRERTVTLQPRRRVGRLAGRVVDREGRPLPGVSVVTYVENSGRVDTTGTDGSFRLDDVLPGRVVVWGELGTLGALGRTRVEADLPEGGEVSGLVLVLGLGDPGPPR